MSGLDLIETIKKVASSCLVSVNPKKSIKEKVKTFKIYKDSLLSGLVFNKKMFSFLLEPEKC